MECGASYEYVLGFTMTSIKFEAASSAVPTPEISYRQIAGRAWPIILANAAVPLLGLVDTAVIGHFGSVSELAALAVASLLFSFIYWGFGFLRMGTTGKVAHADGANDEHALLRVIIQSLILALGLSGLLLLLNVPILDAALKGLSPPTAVAPDVAAYFHIRIWAAPATLIMYVSSGVFIGRGQSRIILYVQLLLNGLNAVLDVLFAGIFNFGIEGIALGTCIAEYVCAGTSLVIIARGHAWSRFFSNVHMRELRHGYIELLSQNRDIFIRTLFLLGSFAFFTRISGGFGEQVLAANHILLQFVAFSAFFLDGYAHVLESLAGRAIGAGSMGALTSALRKTSVFAFATALVLAITIYAFGGALIHVLTDLPDVSHHAADYLGYAAFYVVCAFAAFQLDGLFIGASYGAAMRNCSVISALFFFVCWYAWFNRFDNDGLWGAFILYVVMRAVALGFYMPVLLKKSGLALE